MHNRHPKIRRCGQSELRKNLRAIARSLPAPDRIAELLAIDRRHAGWCENEEWTKDGGKYAKGLANWTAPTVGRWKDEPPDAVPKSAGFTYPVMKSFRDEANQR